MAHMKLKKISKKKKISLFILIIFTYIVFVYTIYYSFKNNQNHINQSFIKYILNNGNANLEQTYTSSKIFNKTLNYLLKIDLENPETLFNNTIINTIDMEDNPDIEYLKQISSYIEDPYQKEITNPIIYIYNSHQLENYNNENLSIYGITPNVLMASYLLKEKLNSLGINTIVEDTNLTEFLELNKWNTSSSYKASRIFMLDKLNTYPSLKYYIDIHRDSVSKDVSTVKINNKGYAKILFVIGLEHDNYQENLNLANELNNLFNKKYPNLSRGIYKKEGKNVDGIYNQDISANAMLIELGGVDNNIDEVLNTINAISDVFKEFIGDNK